ncbi:MAG: hypothetical protein ACKOVB_15735 [Terrabacter sp.]
MAVRSVLLPRTTLTFIAASGLALSGAVALGTGWAASATPSDPHKVWVCKYVQKPHQNEVLKAGKNPIFVDWASLTGKASAPHVGDTFSDAHDKSLVIQIGGTDPGRAACPGGTPPTTTHTAPPTTTHTAPPTTTHTAPPTMTHTVPPTKTHTMPPTKTHTMPATTSTMPGGGGAGGGDNGGVVGNGGFVGNGGNGGTPGPVPGFGAPDTGGDGDGTPVGLLVGPGLLGAGIAIALTEAERRRRSARG